jgi:hypothetical protein
MTENHHLQHDDRHDLSEEELAALKARMEESADAGGQAKRLSRVDRLLSETPMVGPSAGFALRVMAAIAAMELPDLTRRRLATGFAVGLAVAALFMLPVLSGLVILLVSVFTNPGVLHAGFELVTNGMGYGMGLVSDLGENLSSAVNDTPMLPALLTTVIPITMLWVWAVWYLMRKPRLMPDRQDVL